MGVRTMVTTLLCATAFSHVASAQTIPVSVFVDGGVMVERESRGYDAPTDAFGGRGAVGFRVSDQTSLRLEIDVPGTHVSKGSESQLSPLPPPCPVGAPCYFPGPVPFRYESYREVRILSAAFLFAHHFPTSGRLDLSLLAGGGVEEQSGSEWSYVDEFDANGRLLRRRQNYVSNLARESLAAVLGVDAQVKVADHVAVTPLVRLNISPENGQLITRAGLVFRWLF